MHAEPTRQILWNVNSMTNVVTMYALFAAALVVSISGVLRRVELLATGKPDQAHSGHYVRRFWNLLTWALFQRGVVRQKGIALAHTLIYFGFLVLLFTTTMVFIDNDLGIRIYRGNFYLAVTVMSDLLGLGVIIGCALAAHRRYIQKPDLLHNRPGDSFLLSVLVLLCVQGFFLEGLRIYATNDAWAAYSPVGRFVASFFWFLSPGSAASLHFLVWWFHTITVFGVLAIFPYTKLFHVLVSSANLFFRFTKRPAGALRSPGDLEKLMEQGEEFSLGLGNIKDYSWKHLMDLDACTSCGRCQAACPAYASGKPLSPKWMVLDTRNHALALNASGQLGASLLPDPLVKLDHALTLNYLKSTCDVTPSASGKGYSSTGAFRGANELVQNAARSIGGSADDRVSGDVLDPDVFWSCTTCMACVEACPVGINHVEMIVENRRNMVLMQGELPGEAQKTLRDLENRGNPYGPPDDRIKWLEGLDVKILKPGDSVDVLYWVGCVSAYDPRKQKIAKALVQLMKKARLSFGILGNAEGCSGDPARRLGEENLFQTLAKQNLETLRSIQFKTLVANCPHCFHTMKNEYPELGNLGEGRSPEIIHHSQLLRRLMEQGKIRAPQTEGEVTIHDPCYLGRYNEEYDAPREPLRSNPKLKILEMDRSREKAMCCGAGGGHFWMDMKVGERVNVLRVEQAAETGAKTIATACPFCMQMLEDGVKLTDHEGKIEVKDIAEFLAEGLG